MSFVSLGRGITVDLIFQRRASAEYHATLRHYDRIAPRLRDRFVAAVDAAVRRILADPTSHAAVLSRFQRVRVNGFPCALFFCLLSDNSVGLVAVSHTSRRPGYWRHRRFGSE